MNNFKIALYGMFGVYNYGCEAIVRGSVNVIRNKWPNSEIILITPRIEDDKKRLEDLNIKFIERKSGFFRKVVNKVCQKVGLGKLVYRESLKWIDDVDMVFSVGGDLYTLPGGYEETKGKYYNQLIHFGDIVQKKGKKMIIYGCSIGPFECSQKAKNEFIRHLKNVNLIVARENETINYLNNNSINENIIFAPDPAFTIKTNIKKNILKEKLSIGINLSPLSIMDNIGKESINNIKENHKKTILNIYTKYNCKINLIPHVISDDINDDDYRYLESIYNELKCILKNDIILLEKNLGFIGTKSELAKIDVLICARMHCAINALEISIPTILLSYSKKSLGMAQYVYGNTEYVIPLKEFGTNKFDCILEKIITERDNISEYLDRRNNEIEVEVKTYNNDFIEKLYRL